MPVRRAQTGEGCRIMPHRIVAGVDTSPVTTAALAWPDADADLLVLGSCGHDPIAGLLLGFTRERCAPHTHRPVVIIHAAGEQRLDGPADPVGRSEVTP